MTIKLIALDMDGTLLNREKLINYYKIFINKGITDPNVHPWIKESWELLLFSSVY
jgi:hydroxymethylpyrimidine pyrophosphatase-like HAD family hydrolase